MQSKAKTVEQYLAELPADRRSDIEAVRQVVLENLPQGYEESMLYGMITYVIPLRLYPAGYLGNPKMPLGYVALASQKNYMSIYLTNIYADRDMSAEQWFKKAYEASGKKMDVGKSCVRFRKLDDLPLDVIGQAVARTSVESYIKMYEESRKKK